MKHIEELVRNYLRLNTDYALFITGRWGIGKTYYYNNTLIPVIKNTKIKDKKNGNTSKELKPVYISLFGIKTIEDLQTQILLSIYSINGDKKKLATSIVSACVRGAASFFDVNVGAESVTSSALNVRGFEDLVLCFDDIERKEDNLGLKEFAGYISLLLENYSAKIILIANETEIKDNQTSEEKNNWKAIKDKIVGNSINFNPDLSYPVDSIIEKTIDNSNCQLFLKDELNFIVDSFSKTSKNLRVLKYSLSCFEFIFSTIEQELNNFEELKQDKNKILKDILYFTIIISEEYRLGLISYSEKKGIDMLDVTITMRKLLDNRNSEKKEESYVHSFNDKYYSFHKFYFYSSIYDYITGGLAFNMAHLIDDLKQKYRINKTELSPEYVLYEDLNWYNCYKLSEKEYKSKTREFVKLVSDGIYPEPNIYLTSLYYVFRFNNILGYKKEQLVKRIISGVNKAELDFNNFVPEMIKIDTSNDDLLQYRKIIISQILTKYETYKRVNDLSVARKYEELCIKDIYSFCTSIYSDGIFKIFANFSVDTFFNSYIKASNEMKYTLASTFVNKVNSYGVGYITQLHSFIEKLILLFEKGMKQYGKKTIGGYLYIEFLEELKKIIQKHFV